MFHYLPFSFCGVLDRAADVSFARQPAYAEYGPDEDRRVICAGAAPDYFLNVPQLLERMRTASTNSFGKTGGMVAGDLLARKGAWVRQQEKHASVRRIQCGCGWPIPWCFRRFARK